MFFGTFGKIAPFEKNIFPGQREIILLLVFFFLKLQKQTNRNNKLSVIGTLPLMP